MTANEPPTDPELEIHCRPAVIRAAAELVAITDKLGVLGRSAAGRRIVRQLFPGWRDDGGTGPHWLAKQILPFYRYCRSDFLSRDYKALVPTNLVIGHSWNWSPENLDGAEQTEVINKAFTAFHASTPERAHFASAQYCYIRALGIVLAHEGKNRVALFKERSLPHIPAVVIDEDYPAAERLRIFELPGRTLAVLDNRFVERVGSLNLVRQLMEAYGVQVENKWPVEFSELSWVLADLDKRELKLKHERYAVDMDKLRLDIESYETLVNARLLDIAVVKLPSIRMWFGVAGLCFMILALQITRNQWPDIHFVITLMTGALGSLLAVPLFPLVKCSVRSLNDRQRTRRFGETRNRLAKLREPELAGTDGKKSRNPSR